MLILSTWRLRRQKPDLTGKQGIDRKNDLYDWFCQKNIKKGTNICAHMELLVIINMNSSGRRRRRPGGRKGVHNG